MSPRRHDLPVLQPYGQVGVLVDQRQLPPRGATPHVRCSDLLGRAWPRPKLCARCSTTNFTHPRIALVALAMGLNTSLIFQTSDADAVQPIDILRRGSAVVSIDLCKRSAMDSIRNG